MSILEGTGGFEVRRAALTFAVTLTVAAIAVGTWVLGSGSDPVEQERISVVADLRVPDRAQPPVPVAPPPAAEADQDGQ
ncbi:hypothetical protein [Sporichthya sp.]|uniref:hypothetical protein n=1 Tax=Sporichthya sp. TaxID=65475 RepID=UPI0017AFAB53|nr:hypothetical protein [Sporichthya sp.]MBA3742697.1 hypothetical protein [Sporichthya sp.]